MRVLSIDIGSTNYAYAILEKVEDKKYRILKINFLSLAGLEIQDKLKKIFEVLSVDIKEFSIDMLIFENSLFVGKYAQLLNYVCGLTYFLGGLYDKPVKEISAKGVKKRITGDGKADKKMVEQSLAQFIINKPDVFENDHCSDAVAIGIAGTL